MKKPVALSVLLLIVFSHAFGADEGAPSPSELQEQLMGLGFRIFKEPVEAPDFELVDLEGTRVSLATYRGKLVFLNFWATWCPPCRAEMPSMQELYDNLGGESFEVVAVDLQESNKTVQGFIDEFGFTFSILLDETGRTAAQYGARSIPTTYLIDAEGRAIGFLVGSRSWDGEMIESLFRNIIDQ